MLRECLGEAVERSFNSITVDGDSSTNDTLLVFPEDSRTHRASPQKSDRGTLLRCSNRSAWISRGKSWQMERGRPSS